MTLKGFGQFNKTKKEESNIDTSDVLSDNNIIPEIVDGRDGKDGRRGRIGFPGPPGERGDGGLSGIPGQRGQQGKAGLIGEQGEQGLIGEQGEQGVHGEQGEKGLAGNNGKDGKKGDKGEKGIQGEKGLAGNNGKDGKDGKNGKDGKQGKSGLVGKIGKQGIKGEQGVHGEKGEQGEEGFMDVQFPLKYNNKKKRISVDTKVLQKMLAVSPTQAQTLENIDWVGLAGGGAVGIRDNGSMLIKSVSDLNFKGSGVTVQRKGKDVELTFSDTGTFTESASVPSSPLNGDRWHDTNVGKLYTYVTSESAWIEF